MGKKDNTFFKQLITKMKSRRVLVSLIVICIAIAAYYIITSKPKIKENYPAVEVEKVERDNVSI